MKILKYSGAALLFAIMTLGMGCNDKKFLDESIHQLTTATAYTTPTQIDMAIGYLHNRMQYMMYAQASEQGFLFNGVGLDTYAAVGDVTFPTSDWRLMNSSNGFVELWADNLSQMISYSNTIIDACDNNGIRFTSDQQKNQYKAEAVFFRAWAHRCLVGMFGDWPIITAVAKTPKLDFKRSPRVDVWKQCLTDLTFSAENLPLTTAQPGRIVRAAADHFLSEICLSLGDNTGDKKYYDTAIAAATRVIGGTDGNYSLMTSRYGTRATEAGKNVYWDLFRAGNFNYQDGNKEAIWVVQYDYAKAVANQGGAPGSATSNRLLYEQLMNPKWYYNSRTESDASGHQVYVFGPGAVTFPGNVSSVNGDDYSGYVESTTFCRPTNYFLYNIWNGANANDMRNSEAVIQRQITQAGGALWSDVYAAMRAAGNGYKIIATDTILISAPRMWKFSTDKHINGDPKLYDADVYMARLSETYLLRAEAYMKSGNTTAAAQDINVVRGRAQAPLAMPSDITMDYILDERARELYGEEFRLVTLTRLSTKANPVLVNRVRKYGWNFPNLINDPRPNIQDNQWLYPIPQTIINSNTGATFAQNEGY